MPRGLAKTDPRIARERRERALSRAEIRGGTEPRQSSTGLVSMAVKVVDPATTEMIAEFLAKRQGATQ